MSKASEIIILCEDQAHEVFVRRFLKKTLGIKYGRMLRVVDYPGGQGSGKNRVLEKFVQEVKNQRQRQAATILIVVHDVDEDAPDQARQRLDDLLKKEAEFERNKRLKNKLRPRTENESIVYILPKWSIETWLAYLDGKQVDENDKYTYSSEYKKKNRSEKHELIDRLQEKCSNRLRLERPPPSLKAACREFERIRGKLKGQESVGLWQIDCEKPDIDQIFALSLFNSAAIHRKQVVYLAQSRYFL